MASKVRLAVEALDALTNDDPEVAHAKADAILLSLVPPVVEDAYERARSRAGFWYA